MNSYYLYKQMKYYESSFDDYIDSIKKYNIHPELDELYKCIKCFYLCS